MKKKIFIAGANSALAKDFLSRYHVNYSFILASRNMPLEFGEWLQMDFNSYNSDVINNVADLDGLVYFNGITSHTPVKLTRKRHIDSIFNINFYGAFLLTADLLRLGKLKNASSLVYLSSVASKYPYFGGSLYTASKAALEGMVKTLAIELAQKDILVNAVAPAFIDNSMGRSIANFSEEDQFRTFHKRHPHGIVAPNEVSATVDFLLKREGKITGQVIQVGNFNSGISS